MLSYVLIFVLLFYNGEASVVHGKHVVVNGSLEKVQLGNESVKEEQIKRVNPPPIVEVIHGKVNSVIHEIRGSLDDIPPLLSDAKQKDELLSPTHLKHNTVTYELTESENGGSSGVETILEEVLQTRAASDLIENTTSSILVGHTGALPEPPSLPSEENKPVPPAPSNGTKDDQPHDDIPSFSEWAKKQMAEAEKNKGENLTVGTVKVRLKNYASPDCGAKVVASNPEAASPGAILSPSRDDYMLNACNVKIWFVVELCEAIQPQRIEIANFELYSSSPKELTIWVSDRFPTREWSLVNTIVAKDERTVQTFPLPQLSNFAKYVKVELQSHYGTEHFCPISLFKAFGTSELEVLENVDRDAEDDDENINTAFNEPFDEDEDAIGKADHLSRVIKNSDNVNNNDPVSDDNVKPLPGGGGSTNLLGTAKDAVLSIVKKAAEVLVKGDESNGTCGGDKLLESSRQCITPAYLIVCSNCTDEFYNRVFEYLSCSGIHLEKILSCGFVRRMLLQSRMCPEIGLNWGLIQPTPLPLFKEKLTIKDPDSLALDYLRAFLHPETIAALCNYLAISEKKVSLNTSQNILDSESSIPDLATSSVPNNQETLLADSEPVADFSQSQTIPPTPDNTLVSSISPTKTLAKEEVSAEINDTKESTEKQPKPHEENITASEAPEVTPSATAAKPSAATTKPTTASSQQVPPVTSATVEDSSIKNETDKFDNQVPTPHVTPAVPAVVQDDVDQLTLASLFPELEEEGVTEPATTKTTTTSQNSPTQKESVFVRLANRIKALEVNMSLSGQYLEELSRRYKKQVEELQRTLSNMVEERRLASERENLQAAQISSLTNKVDALTMALSELISEREKASMIGQHGMIIVVEVVVFLIVLAICRWLGAAKSSNSPDFNHRPASTSQSQQQMRRHSVDNVDGPSLPKLRRPSEEACLSSGTTHKELLVDGVKRKTSRDGTRRRKRRRKERWEDEGIVVIGANGEESTVWEPPTQDYNVRTALWSRAKRTSHTQTSSSQETLCSVLTQNNNNSSTATTTSSSNAAKPKKSGGGAIKKIVRKFF